MDEKLKEKKKGKPKYEAPVLMDLGELVRGQGANCISGSAANPGCVTGVSANVDCVSGGAKRE